MAAYFFATSVLAKLYHQEAGSDCVEELVRNPGNRILISLLTVVEMRSVIALKVRSQAISTDGATAVRRRFLSDIRSGVFEILALTAPTSGRNNSSHHTAFATESGRSTPCSYPLPGAYQMAYSTMLWLQIGPCSRWRHWSVFR